jgi:hypothetical protein
MDDDLSRGSAARSDAGARRRRRWVPWVVVGVIVVVVIWSALAAFKLLDARRHAQRGLDQLELTRDTLGPADLIRGKGLPNMRAAQAEFQRASDSAGSPLLAPFKVLPFVGRQVRSVDALASSASKVSGIGVETMDQSSHELNRPSTTGVQRVVLTDRLGAIARGARDQLRSVDLGPGSALIGPLQDAHDKFATQLGRLRTAMADADDAATGLGAMLRGPSRYLVLAANNGEMRAGSGMLLSAGVLELQNGRFQLGPMTDTALLMLPPGAVPMSGDLAARWGFANPNQEWRNLALTPQFPATAELASRMWKARTGQSVDGVIAIDPAALQGLIAASGPVNVNGTTITKDNVISQILLTQYLTGDPGSDQRHTLESDIARAVVAQLEAKGWDTANLVDDLRDAANGRHVLAWSSKPVQQRAWTAAGLSGLLPNDGLLVALNNTSGNKLDQFMHVRGSVAHQPVAGGSRVTVTVDVSNDAPQGVLPRIIIGPFSPDFQPGEYQGILAIDIPQVARDIRYDSGGPLVASGPDYTTRVSAIPIDLQRGARHRYVLRFTVPNGYFHTQVEPSARIPGIAWTAGGARWQDDVAHPLSW